MKIGLRAIVIILAAVTLSCAQAKSVTYRCDEGKNFVVVFDSKGDFATLKLSEREVSLPRVLSASGAKYSDGQTTFLGKGAEAFVEIDGRIVCQNCRTGGDR
ncbi:MAG: MliC family protein [Deltaproteobacteria bacterium]|nr:MliC family protein [Deltaproteobacteria bacterium]